MDIRMLKRGFWGYKKSGVCEYVAAMNEEFSHKLIDTLKSHDLREKELKEKISALESENAILREDRDRVSMVFMDAKKFSDGLRRDAEAENQAFRDSNMAYNTEQRRRIEAFCASIDQIRNEISGLLNQFDAELSETRDALSSVDDGLLAQDSCAEAGETYRAVDDGLLAQDSCAEVEETHEA